MTTTQILYISILSIYYAVVIVFFFRILLENKNPLKTQSYLLLMLLLPIIGMMIYLFFGVNYRKSKLYSRKAFRDQKIIQRWIREYNNLLNKSSANLRGLLHEKARLPFLFWRNNYADLSDNNKVTVFNSGDEKIPVLCSKLQEAKNHIHLEYYIFEDDRVGSVVVEILCAKAKQGVRVRVIIDALGSSALSAKSIRRMKNSGVELYKYHPVIFTSLANRVNYRDHRKIVVIDGKVGFVGGINLAERYQNSLNEGDYWRDTHCMIEGYAVSDLQIIFILNWYFVSKKLIKPDLEYFPVMEDKGGVLTSIISSDPDSDNPNLMEGYFGMITSAQHEILIITPYFIPNESILTALKTIAKSGVEVKVLIPKKSDSVFVHAASQTYIGELIRNDIKVFYYKKGMIHSKVMIIDEELSTIGTANMDYRSFDNNAEVNAVFFDRGLAAELKQQFCRDILQAQQVDYLSWKNRPFRVRLIGSIGRVIAPLL